VKAEDAEGTPTQTHISPSILLQTNGCEDNNTHLFEDYGTIKSDNSTTRKADNIHRNRSTCFKFDLANRSSCFKFDLARSVSPVLV